MNLLYSPGVIDFLEYDRGEEAIFSRILRGCVQNIPFAVEALKKWFSLKKRDLPWRQSQDPYVVWVSEIMLQQTQVSVVIDYYLRFMHRFPTIQALASARLEEVIKQWEGLGYYSRARHLHQAAQFLVLHHGGKLPNNRKDLSKVKGLGPYTIGAILSFAFRQRAAALDGNAVRVLSRYFAVDECVDQTKGQKTLWNLAEAILPEEAPWEVVEGIIELGATVCKKQPECLSCPLKENCRAFAYGIENQLPKKGKKVEILTISRRVFVICAKGQIFVKKPAGKKVMGDLFEFPYSESLEGPFPFPFEANEVQRLPAVKHSFTRYRVTLFPSLWKAAEPVDLMGFDWIAQENIANYPFSAGHRRILQGLMQQQV